MINELTEELKQKGYKRFRTRTGEEARLTHESGHIQVITDVFVPVHPMFHRDAYANGCVDEEMLRPGGGFVPASGSAAPPPPPSLTPEQRKERILDAIIEMTNTGDITKFTAGGVPKADILSEMVGFTVPAAERDAIFKELMAEKED